MFLNNFLIKIAVLQAGSRKTARLFWQPTRTEGSLLSNKSTVNFLSREAALLLVLTL
jgi:hypothetical protein